VVDLGGWQAVADPLHIPLSGPCVYPIALWETDALRHFMSEVNGPVNAVRLPQTPLADLAAAGVARVSWGPFLHLNAMARFGEELASLQE
jgi:2-methylisocitrate lyase-like PEP mutase family enzyme